MVVGASSGEAEGTIVSLTGLGGGVGWGIVEESMSVCDLFFGLVSGGLEPGPVDDMDELGLIVVIDKAVGAAIVGEEAENEPAVGTFMTALAGSTVITDGEEDGDGHLAGEQVLLI